LSLCILNSREREGIRAPAVTVEGHLADDLTALSIVGLPEPAVRESKDRGRGALLNSHFRFPTGRVTINLAPADLPKEGGRFDLPIAVGVLGASGQLKCDLLDRLEVHGELAFSGSLRPVTGILLAALAALAALWRRGMRGGPSSCPARTRTKRPSSRVSPSIPQITFFRSANTSRAPHCCPHSSTPSPVVPSAVIYPDLAEVRGQE